jgi:hypothetical protein
MEDPEATHMLNATPRAMTRDELGAYIKSFDQRTKGRGSTDTRPWISAYRSGATHPPAG